MASLIVLMTFSFLVVILLVWILTHSNSEATNREDKLVSLISELTSRAAVTTQSLSTDTTELVTKALQDSNQTMLDLFLGREQERSRSQEQQNEMQERQPIPGIETFEGLPSNVQEALEREAAELDREITNPQWRTVSGMQPNGSVGSSAKISETPLQPTPESHWMLIDDLPQS